MRAATQRQALAEKVDGHVVVAEAAVGWQGDLMRPVTVHHRFAQLAFAVDHRKPSSKSPPALDCYLPAKKVSVRGNAGGLGVLASKEQKGNKFARKGRLAGGSKAPWAIYATPRGNPWRFLEAAGGKARSQRKRPTAGVVPASRDARTGNHKI